MQIVVIRTKVGTHSVMSVLSIVQDVGTLSIYVFWAGGGWAAHMISGAQNQAIICTGKFGNYGAEWAVSRKVGW